jgi:uncharacterized OB-fold protein
VTDVPPRDDPTTAPFWEGVGRRELMVQRCADCGTHQFYPRPFCLTCNSTALDWTVVPGAGSVYSLTTVRIQIGPEFEPPYVVAIVQLDEGPRLLTNIVNGECAIGDRVRVAWRETPSEGLLPVFEPLEEAADEQT